MTPYTVKQVDKFRYLVYRNENDDEILEKIYEFLFEIESYIVFKNGYIKEFKELKNE
jgi:hypothetical protein